MIEDMFKQFQKVWAKNKGLLGRGCFCVRMYGPAKATDWDDSSSESSELSTSHSSSGSEGDKPNLQFSTLPGQNYYVRPDSKSMVMHVNVVLPAGTKDERETLSRKLQGALALGAGVPTASVQVYNMFGSWKAGVVIDPQVFYHVVLPGRLWIKPDIQWDHRLSSVDRLWFLDTAWKDEAETHELEWTLNKI